MEKIKEMIKDLKSLLRQDQLEQDIIELQNTPKNNNIISFLEEIGDIEVEFEIKQDDEHRKYQGRIREKEGYTYLWYKNTDDTWVVLLWVINRLYII